LNAPLLALSPPRERHHPLAISFNRPACRNPMSKLAIIKEFWDFLRVRKKWWLVPIVLFLLVLGALLVFAKGSALAPFIYSLF
jgi:hypothetical protein